MDKTRVLIIEDESITALEIQKKLETWGYHVVGVAGSGEDAIEIARENKLDLILADIILKGEMDGVEAIEHIYEITDAPVIYLTAHGRLGCNLPSHLCRYILYIHHFHHLYGY